jgi:tetratricopeptide (TPR) repeat protein
LQNGPTVWLYRPGIQPAETFDESLFEGLRSIAETTMVLRFEENLASALFVKGRYAKCAQLAEASLALAPNQTRLVNTFAWTLYRMKRYPEALAMADRSLSAIPGAADMLALRGSSRLRVGDDRNGERDLQEAITKGAKTEIPYLDLEWLYRRRNDRESQVITLRRYLATLAPGSANALRTQEYLRQLTGK